MRTGRRHTVRISALLEEDIKAFKEKNYPYTPFTKASELYAMRSQRLEHELQVLKKQQDDNRNRRGLV